MSNDLNILPVTAGGATALNFDNAGGTFVTGSHTTAQKFVTFLLAQLGSVLHSLDFGTDFVYDMRSGILRNEAELSLAFATVVSDAADYQQEVTAVSDPEGTTPPSELFQSATLNNFEYVGDRLILNITVITQDGSTEDIALPIVVVET